MLRFDIRSLLFMAQFVVLAGLNYGSPVKAALMVGFAIPGANPNTNLFWNKVPDPQTIQPFIARDSGEQYEFYATSPQTTFAEGGQAGGVFGGVPGNSSPFNSLTFSSNVTLPAGSSFTFRKFSANVDAERLTDGFLRVDVVGIGFAPFSTILNNLGNGVNRLDVFTTTALESISSITITTVNSSSLLTATPVNQIESIRQFRVDDFSAGASTVVPEPASLTVFGLGAVVTGIGAALRRRRQSTL